MKQYRAVLGLVLALGFSGCIAPMTYRNEFVTVNAPKASYKQIALQTDGFFADQLGLALRKSMASQGLAEGKGDIAIRVSSRVNIYSRKEGLFKRRARPAVNTLTVQAIRVSDQEVVYSLVKQYKVMIDKRKGNVITDGWVDQAATELADELARNLLPGAPATK